MLVAHGFRGGFSAARTRVGGGRGQRSARQERSRDSTVASKQTNKLEWSDLDERTVNLIRVLAMDAVENEGSGHPGTAMSLAPAAYLLYQRIMRHDPMDPAWSGRDRFVLSCGHSSLTLYIQLYLSGYGLTLEDLKAYRSWGSLTPGHPEHGLTPGVETTTGPLGQGLGNAVGMAMAARRERGLFDPDTAEGQSPFDHHVYVFASDGDIEEGITHEASAIAGVQELGNLIVLYDDNHISIEDDTVIAKDEDTAARYEAYGWHVQRLNWDTPNGYHEDVQALYDAFEAAKSETTQPSFISLRTIISWAAPTQTGTALPARPEQAGHRRRARLGPGRCRGGRDQEGPRVRPGRELPARPGPGRPRPPGARPRPGGPRRMAAGPPRLA